MNISIIGTGYVGLVTGACFARLGNRVICMDSDKRKIDLLKDGVMPIFEPDLEKLVSIYTKQGMLEFVDDVEYAVDKSELIFLCVGTPSGADGSADLGAVKGVCRDIAKAVKDYRVIIEKSTVPVRTNEVLNGLIREETAVHCDIACNPETLKEGTAIHDFMNPDRLIIGTETGGADSALIRLINLYRNIASPYYIVDINSAELIKHASNAALAQKISFINMIAQLCEKTGADVIEVARAVGADKRIGRDFLNAGIGWGGSCFPKDLQALMYVCREHNIDAKLLEAVYCINEGQRGRFVDRIESGLGGLEGKVIGVLGLSFKPGTDDMRYAPSIHIISELMKRGAEVNAYDPKAMEKAKELEEFFGVVYCKDEYQTAEGVDALVILTEWKQFEWLDKIELRRIMGKPVIFDGRNIYSLDEMERLGFAYISIGRKAVNSGSVF